MQRLLMNIIAEYIVKYAKDKIEVVQEKKKIEV